MCAGALESWKKADPWCWGFPVAINCRWLRGAWYGNKIQVLSNSLSVLQPHKIMFMFFCICPWCARVCVCMFSYVWAHHRGSNLTSCAFLNHCSLYLSRQVLSVHPELVNSGLILLSQIAWKSLSWSSRVLGVQEASTAAWFLCGSWNLYLHSRTC